MKRFNLSPRYAGPGAVALLACISTLCLTSLRADDTNTLQANQIAAQRSFVTPDDAVNTLRTATESGDQAALGEIFGPDYHSLATGDPVQDAHNARRFALEMAVRCQQVKNDDGSIGLEVGTNQWPMPIPLVKGADGQWLFDTAAGKEEIINRHVGKDELHAIGVCRAYVLAQKAHAAADKKGCYALMFASAEGMHDGLYWPVSLNGEPSPFGPRLAAAQVIPDAQHQGPGPQPFHGYYFKILTRQGPDAPGGKMDFLDDHKLVRGFALLAWPEHWDQSGIMTFMVGPEGKVYQKNLGAETRREARHIRNYSPDATWTLVLDDGVVSAAME